MDEKGELIRSYSNLSIDYKRIELEREIAEISLIIRELLTDLNPDYPKKEKIVSNDFSKDTMTEDKYLTYLYGDVMDLKEVLGEYCDFATSLYYDSSDFINLDD